MRLLIALPAIFGLTLLSRISSCNGEVTAVAVPSQPLRIALAGDSTVCDWPSSHPNRGWGQFVGEYFAPGKVILVNLAASGRSTKTFLKEGRWNKLLAGKPNIILIQFGHNDSHDPQKPGSTDPANDFRDNLRRYVDEARAGGAVPILVTPMVRRNFAASGRIDESLPRSLSAYALAMKAVGEEKKVFVIDLHSSSKALAEKLGPTASGAMASTKEDNTHFNEKGARAMAALVMTRLPEADPRIKAVLKDPCSR
jgi:lysophospholipase L1-like esterase